MNSADLRRMIGATREHVEYAPLAILLTSGYACFGHVNAKLNEEMEETIVLLNAQLMEVKHSAQRTRPVVEDFREFLLEVVATCDPEQETEIPMQEELGKPIPLIAVPLDQIAIVYPVAQIVQLISQLDNGAERPAPGLFDLNRSEILSLLRMKVW